jgi:DNA-binding SARP family transcriptional activator
MGMMSIHLLGKFAAYSDNRSVSGLNSRRLQEFFAYLLLNRNRTFSREILAEQITPDAEPLRSRKALRQVLWRLQTVVDENAHSSEDRLLLVDDEWVTVNADARVWLDVAELEAAYKSSVGQLGENLDDGTADALRKAVSFYRADLLEGCYQDWCLRERERLQNYFLAMLDKLVGYCAAHNQYEEGIVYANHILSYDRARERAHYRLMQLYARAGDRTAALRQYHSCEIALCEELSVAPSRRTSDLYEQISADTLDSILPAPAGRTSVPRDPNDAAFLALTHMRRELKLYVAQLEQILGADPECRPFPEAPGDSVSETRRGRARDTAGQQDS